jgi:TetR/AcrR family transcriptional regulator, ethionamide resistance regulator
MASEGSPAVAGLPADRPIPGDFHRDGYSGALRGSQQIAADELAISRLALLFSLKSLALPVELTALPGDYGAKLLAMRPGRSSAERSRRRRRSPEVAEREILAAAEELLRERPFRDLTVDEVMRRTDLSRPSFYVYFKDRHQLVLRVAERLGDEMLTLFSGWFEGTGPGSAATFREACEGVVAVYDQHGPVLHALSDAATLDPEVEHTYNSIMQTFIDTITGHIEDEIAAQRIIPLDARETARALCLMNDRYLIAALGRNRTATPETVVETLSTIWTRTLYGA